MPHLRRRYLETNLKKVMGLSPLVGLLGHRQVGKTTLLEMKSSKYFTFDDTDELIEAQKRPKDYIKTRAGSWIALDECQTVEAIFPALKEWVRTHKRPGQFILSGSVRFTSRKAIQESLMGRIINLELLPLLVQELHEMDLGQFWQRCLNSTGFRPDFIKKDSHRITSKSIEKYFVTGGLPGVCFIRDAALIAKKINAHLETMLDRDLRKIVPTSIPFPQLRDLAQILADRQGENLSWTELSKASDISAPTLKKLLYGMEAIFLLRSVPVEGDVKGPVYFLEDMAECHYVRNRPLSLVEQITHFLHIHTRGELSYGSLENFRIFQFRTRAGVVIPLVIQQNHNSIGIVPIEGQTPSRQELAGGDSLLKRYARSKIVFVAMNCQARVIDERRLVVPLTSTL